MQTLYAGIDYNGKALCRNSIGQWFTSDDEQCTPAMHGKRDVPDDTTPKVATAKRQDMVETLRAMLNENCHNRSLQRKE